MLVLNKPAGMTSNDAVQQAKRMYRAQKVGHTGSLDPLATGVLPLCFGEATKFSQYLLDADKRYCARIKLGVTTDTGDADGKEIECKTLLASLKMCKTALTASRCHQTDTPMYSALKHNGQPLYKMARQGIEVERKVRDSHCVHENEIHHFADGDECTLELRCSKGTYVRSIAEDLGNALGCGAHVKALHRRAAGPYHESDMLDLAALRQIDTQQGLDALLQPTSVRWVNGRK